jgi:hypothetical protein
MMEEGGGTTSGGTTRMSGFSSAAGDGDDTEEVVLAKYEYDTLFAVSYSYPYRIHPPEAVLYL